MKLGLGQSGLPQKQKRQNGKVAWARDHFAKQSDGQLKYSHCPAMFEKELMSTVYNVGTVQRTVGQFNKGHETVTLC